MKHRLKYLSLLLFFFIFSMSTIATPVFAKDDDKIDVPKVLENTYVYDQGNFIDDEIEKKVNNFLDELEEKSSIEFAVITVPSLNGLTIERYANKLANKLGIGKEKEDNGILLLVSKKDNKVRLEIGDGLQGILTDSISGRILDNYFVPLRKEDNYNQAVFDTVQATINVLAASEEYDFEITGVDTEKTVDTTDGLTIGIIFIIIMVLVILEILTGCVFGDGFGTGIVAAIISSSGSSGKSSFGGGHFGGGGASR